MSEFLLVVEGLMADGSDHAMTVGIDDYKAAMFGCSFAEPVLGYVWCDTHGWVRSDETCVCVDCVALHWEDEMEAAYHRINASPTAKDWAPPEGWACHECGTHSTDVKKRECHDGVLTSLCLDCWWHLYRH